MAKTLLDFVPSNLATLKDSQLVYLVDPSLGKAGDVVVTLGTLKEFLGVVDSGGSTEPPPPPPPGTVATPTFSPTGGTISSSTPVTISCATSGVTIYYTTNGTTPTTASTLYTGAINVSSTLTLKAIAVKSGMLDSAVGSASFTFSAGGGGGGGGSNPTGFINIYGADRAEYPRTYITSRMPIRTGSLITVAAGGNLQTALNSAQPGDWVVLEAGATFTGNFTVPIRSGDATSGGDNVIVVTTSAFASLPEKVRVTDSTNAALFATLKNTNTGNVQNLAISGATQGWRFVGINFTVDSSVTALTRIVSMGDSDGGIQGTLASTPKNIIIDRCKFDGHSTLNLRRAIGLDAEHSAVINSWFGDEIHHSGSDCQDILAINTPGPLKIVNNRLSGATEVVMFGGGTATVGMPSDIEFRYNYVTRPYAWKGVTSWQVKNIFEIKKARRVLVEGNIFENVWLQGQTGVAMLIKHEPYGDESLGQTEDVIFKSNIVRNACGGMNIASIDGSNGGPLTYTIRRIVELNMLYYDIANTTNQNDQPYLQAGLSNNCVHSHCTYLTGDGSANAGIKFNAVNTSCIYKDLIFGESGYGAKGDSTSPGNASLATWNVSGIFSKNIMTHANTGDDWPSTFPSDCYFPLNVAGINFVNFAGADFALSSSSVYKNQASDGTDPGADITAVNAATAYAISGNTAAIQT